MTHFLSEFFAWGLEERSGRVRWTRAHLPHLEQGHRRTLCNLRVASSTIRGSRRVHYEYDPMNSGWAYADRCKRCLHFAKRS